MAQLKSEATTGPDRMMAAVAGSMKDRTGRSLEEWVKLVDASPLDPLDQKAVRRWLKDTHGVPQNSQWAIADAAARAAGWTRPDVEEYIDRQYTGARSRLRPIFDRIRSIMETFSDDVRIEGRATYIPFVRRRQFAAVSAATQSRIDVGLRYTDAPDSDLLSAAAAPGQATHRLSLTSVNDITADVEKLLRTAYDQNG